MTNTPQWNSVRPNGQTPARRSVRGDTTPVPARRTPATGENSVSEKKKPKKPLWRRVLFWGSISVLAMIIAVSGAFLIAYSRIKVPAPDEFALAEASTVYYADGTTELGKFAEVDRTIIDTSTLPDYVGEAIVASEDRTFFTNSGIDIKGIVRALVNNIFGQGPRQGASTISQGYIENYYMGLDQDPTYFSKLEEALLALKVNQQVEKSEILGNYMNTIFFGRGAYGIEAAADAFFGKHASELTISESAMLAGIMPAPSAWDPAVDPDQAKLRWERVMNFMVDSDFITKEDAAAAKFPTTIEPGSIAPDMKGPNAYLMQQVRDELTTKAELEPELLDSGGLKIVTTVDKKMQDAAMNSVKEMPSDTPASVHIALSSIDNANGEILAEYPGNDFEKNQLNAATQEIAMAGSTFKPFSLLAYLEQDGSVFDYFNGNSPQTFDGTEISNNDEVSFGQINLVTATMYSVNTAFVSLNQEIGPESTLDALFRAGIPRDTVGISDNLTNVLGTAAPHNLDLTAAYATFATGGERVDPHMVREVTRGESTVYKANIERTREFEADIVSSVMPALQAVTSESGTGAKVTALNREIGGKTGTSEEQKSAQFIGFTPQITTGVSMYAVDEKGNSISLPDIGGMTQFHGSDWPTDVWLAYMDVAMSGFPDADFEWMTVPKQGGRVPVNEVEDTPSPEPVEPNPIPSDNPIPPVVPDPDPPSNPTPEPPPELTPEPPPNPEPPEEPTPDPDPTADPDPDPDPIDPLPAPDGSHGNPGGAAGSYAVSRSYQGKTLKSKIEMGALMRLRQCM